MFLLLCSVELEVVPSHACRLESLAQIQDVVSHFAERDLKHRQKDP